MKSKNSPRITAAESAHMAAVKMAGCVVCNASAPNEAHHIEQGEHFTAISVCAECHRGTMGWHGDKTFWRIHKMTPIKALNETLRRVLSA